MMTADQAYYQAHKHQILAKRKAAYRKNHPPKPKRTEEQKKASRKAIRAKYYYANRAKSTALRIAWQKANPEKAKVNYRRYRIKHREKRLAYNRQRYLEMAETRREQSRSYYQENIKERRAYAANYRRKNYGRLLCREKEQRVHASTAYVKLLLYRLGFQRQEMSEELIEFWRHMLHYRRALREESAKDKAV